jgi:tetratricopeptide (TPR) repeat protein
LQEAVYHREVEDAAEALNWFWERRRVFYVAARYAVIEPLYRWALNLAETRLGPDHPNATTRLNNLAGLYYAQGGYAQAQPLYQRALAIREKALGPDHPNVATCLQNYADLLRKLSRTVEAEAMEVRAASIHSGR